MYVCDCLLILKRGSESLNLIGSLVSAHIRLYLSSTLQNHVQGHASRSLAFEILVCGFDFYLRYWQLLSPLQAFI